MPAGPARGFMPEAFGQKQYGAYLCFKGFGLLMFDFTGMPLLWAGRLERLFGGARQYIMSSYRTANVICLHH